MKVTSRSLVFQDSSPGSVRRSSAFPCLAALSDGRLIVSHRVGSVKDSGDGTTFLSESLDGGQTWEGRGTPFGNTWEGVPGELRYGGITELEPGHLLAAFVWFDRSDPEAPLFHPETEGLLPAKILLSESSDGGRTWGQYRRLDLSPMIQPAITGPILRLSDGSLLCAFETNKEYNDPSPWRHQAAGIFSSDNGQTWHTPTVFAADPSGRLFYWDQRPAVLSDGSVFNLYWTFDREEKADIDIHAAWSCDNGSTWTVPMPTGLQGQIATPIPLRDGRVMMAYVHRHNPPSLRVRLSEDGGATWEAAEELVFHNQGTDQVGAADGETDMKSYLQDMELWSFGLPSGLQLPDGDVLVVYYAGTGQTTGIHVARIEV